MSRQLLIFYFDQKIICVKIAKHLLKWDIIVKIKSLILDCKKLQTFGFFIPIDLYLITFHHPFFFDQIWWHFISPNNKLQISVQ